MQYYCSRLNFSLKDEPIEQRPKEPSVDDGQENLTRDGGVDFIPSLNPATFQLAQEDEVNIQVRGRSETTFTRGGGRREGVLR